MTTATEPNPFRTENATERHVQRFSPAEIQALREIAQQDDKKITDVVRDAIAAWWAQRADVLDLSTSEPRPDAPRTFRHIQPMTPSQIAALDAEADRLGVKRTRVVREAIRYARVFR